MEQQKPTKVPEPENPPEASPSTRMNVEIVPAPPSSPTSRTLPPAHTLEEELKNLEFLPSPPSLLSSATASDIWEEGINVLEIADINTILDQIQHSLDTEIALPHAQSTNAGEAEAASSGEKETDDKAKEEELKNVELLRLPSPRPSPTSDTKVLEEMEKKLEMINTIPDDYVIETIPDDYVIEHSPEKVVDPPHEQTTDAGEAEARALKKRKRSAE